jgi:hypothetical protein
MHLVLSRLSRAKLSPTKSAPLFYAGILCLVYSTVVFFGYTLDPAASSSYGITESGPYEYEGRKPLYTWNIEVASSAYYESGIDRAVGDMLRYGQLPLWNPYQAGGTPLAAQYSTRAFSPYQLLADLAPEWTRDFFRLGRLWIGGFFTFLFLVALALSYPAALSGGLFYMLSGAFIWFIHKQEFVNVAMTIPIFFLCMEKLISTGKVVYMCALGGSVALVLLAGQPEIAIYVLLLGVAYAVYRLITARKMGGPGIGKALMVGGGGLLGLGLAAPLILPFLEFASNSFNIHPTGGTQGVAGAAPWQWVAGLVSPTFFETPTQERILPINGIWDYLGGYVGLLTYLFVVLGALRPGRHRGLMFFFGLAGLAIVLKDFGVKPFL